MFTATSLTSEPGCYCACTCGGCEQSQGITSECHHPHPCAPDCARSRSQIHAPGELAPADLCRAVWAALYAIHDAPIPTDEPGRLVDPRDIAPDGRVVRRRSEWSSGAHIEPVNGVRVVRVERDQVWTEAPQDGIASVRTWSVWSEVVLTPEREVAARHTYARNYLISVPGRNADICGYCGRDTTGARLGFDCYWCQSN